MGLLRPIFSFCSRASPPPTHSRMPKSGKAASNAPVRREMTFHLNKKLHKIAHKRRAKRAISEIRQFVAKQMKTKDVRIDDELNKYVWSCGVKNIPTRVRLMLERKRNESEDAAEQMYTLATVVKTDRAKWRHMGTTILAPSGADQ